MKILIVGLSGIEHALAWKLRQSAKVIKIYIAPGNAGTSVLGENIPKSEVADIVAWLKINKVDMVLTGSTSYLEKGLADEVGKLGVSFFGPTKAAAEIEWSKSFAKKFMQTEGIPTAAFEIFSDIEQAIKYVKRQRFPLVIKANGLAFGLGTFIATNLAEAESTLRNLMAKKIFSNAGNVIIIEEFLEGREISIHAFCDGCSALLFPPALGYTKLLEDDKGPNTGGMGSITPVPWVTSEMMTEIKEKIVLPTLRGLKKIGRPFTGILFPGVMLTTTGPVVLELNARFGHPETHTYMRILKTDLVDILLACAKGNLKNISVEWAEQYACSVVAAASGYPGKHKKGIKINGLDALVADPDIVVFQSGTRTSAHNTIIDRWGLALGVSAVGNDVNLVIRKVYKALEKIKFDGMKYRTDIGSKGLIYYK